MACCPSHDTTNITRIPARAAEATSTPAWSSYFTETNIKSGLKDGYWIEAFPFHSRPDPNEGPVGPEIIAYGLGFQDANCQPIPSDVRMHLNPYHEMKNQVCPPNEWPVTVIQKLNFPVSVTYGNFRPKSGLNDGKSALLIVCHEYGPSMDNLNEEGGIVSYLKNPGNRKQLAMWERRDIGKFPAMHRDNPVIQDSGVSGVYFLIIINSKRFAAGHFTQKRTLEIMALPIIVRSGDRETPAPVIIYTPVAWDEDGTPSKWETRRPLDCVFRLIHDVQVIHSTDANELDKALVAGREGISLMWMDQKTSQWRYENIGTGIPQARIPHNNPYWGSGSVATGRVGNDNVGYIASCEAFHGNIVSVYVKPRGTRPDNIVAQEHWRRFVIDDFGPLKTREFTGTIHHVQCADLDGDGIDSIIVACMGYPENKPANMGTYVYKPVDLSRGRFTRYKISDASAGRIAIADYRCSGTLDVATISYSVPNYLETPNPAIRVMLNNTKQTRSAIKAEKLGEEVKILIPRADTAEHISEMPFLDIGGKVLSIVVLPPRKEYLLGAGFKSQDYVYQKDGVKVINGQLSWNTQAGRATRGIAIDPQKAASMVPDSIDNIVRAGENGAIFVRFESSITTTLPGLRYRNMDDVATINSLPFTAQPAARDLVFPWVASRDRPWAKPGTFNWPFYNQVGYHVMYNDDTFDRLCHIQAWTLATGTTAGFHNHYDRSFCEIHACLSNGTHPNRDPSQLGGMRWAKDKEADKFLAKNPFITDPAILDQYSYKVAVDDMEEHGPLWHIGADGRPVIRPNGTVDYPQHAWLAGPRQECANFECQAPNVMCPVCQAFDVWLAFEFPATEFQTGVSKFHGCAAC